jgi:small subunit ribosomal protein S4
MSKKYNKCKKCRRANQPLFLKNKRCLMAKCSFLKRKYPPGFEPGDAIKKLSEYAKRLREKQKIKQFYGISEKQIRKYYEKAVRSKEMTGHFLLQLCERRLDNSVLRSKFALSRSNARQLVFHGHILVNGKKVDIPSYILKIDDIVTIKEKSKLLIQKNLEQNQDMPLVTWMEYKPNEIKILHMPKREEIDLIVEEQLVVEYYSR